MKRKAGLLGLLIVVLVIGLCTAVYEGNKRPAYEIISTVKSGSDNYETVSINVIVYQKNYDQDEMLSYVCTSYWNLNGAPDELLIQLFNGHTEFEKGIIRVSKRFCKQ